MNYLRKICKKSLLTKSLLFVFATVMLCSCDDMKEDKLVYTIVIKNGETVKLSDGITLNYKTNFWCDGLDGYAQGTVTVLDNSNIEINTKELPDNKALPVLESVGSQGFTIGEGALQLCDARRGFILKTRATNTYNDKPKAMYKFVFEPFTVDKEKCIRIYYQKV